MAHNTNSYKKKENKKNKESKKVEKNKAAIGLHQATHDSCIIHIIFCISNICTHLTPFLTSMSSLVDRRLVSANDQAV